MSELTREQAQAALTEALKNQTAAKAAVAEAVKVVAAAKVNVLDAEGKVLLAKATLARLGGPIATPTMRTGTGQSEVQAAVKEILQGADKSMTVDELFAALQDQGVQMAGTNPRDNLGAYIARWSKVAGSGIKNAGRGLWAFDGPTVPAAEVPSFLQPAVENEAVNEPVDEPVSQPDVPAFLQPDSPVEQSGNIPLSDVLTDLGMTGLPEGFPGRDALTEAGYNTLATLTGKTHDQLRRIKGVGAETARQILAALNPSEA